MAWLMNNTDAAGSLQMKKSTIIRKFGCGEKLAPDLKMNL